MTCQISNQIHKNLLANIVRVAEGVLEQKHMKGFEKYFSNGL